MTVLVKAPAKVNLYLDVIGKDPERDYHFISTVLAVTPGLQDEIEVEPLDGHFQVIMDIDPTAKYETPAGEDNSCFQAASLLHKAAIGSGMEHKVTAVQITLKKNTPNQAGLGGGSSDAASTLKALNKLWNLNFPNKKLKEIAARISMDAVFFIEPADFAYATGFGEIVEPIETDLKLNIEIIETGIEVSTNWAYGSLDLEKCRKNADKAKEVILGLEDGDKERVLAHLHNDFEYLVFEKYPELKEAVEKRRAEGAHAILCGSGGCIAVIS